MSQSEEARAAEMRADSHVVLLGVAEYLHARVAECRSPTAVMLASVIGVMMDSIDQLRDDPATVSRILRLNPSDEARAIGKSLADLMLAVMAVVLHDDRALRALQPDAAAAAAELRAMRTRGKS